MKTKTIGLLLVVAVLFSCATADRGGTEVSPSVGNGGDGLSLDEAIAQSARDIAAKLPEGTRVAVVAFESPEQNLSGYLMDEIAGVLTDGGLEVADRSNLELVLKEQGFQFSGEVDEESAVSIGKLLGARYVLTGQLVNLGDGYRYRLNGINVETAVQESSIRLVVRNDQSVERMLAAMRDTAPAVQTATYGGK
ncbi:MAG: CsgG/HfaB family protein [Spirochaetaceae bacterium]|jgi:TolB-like protein|nr:CsgG/HfaB family protein [Spirochaetaceae bacterium]